MPSISSARSIWDKLFPGGRDPVLDPAPTEQVQPPEEPKSKEEIAADLKAQLAALGEPVIGKGVMTAIMSIARMNPANAAARCRDQASEQAQAKHRVLAQMVRVRARLAELGDAYAQLDEQEGLLNMAAAQFEGLLPEVPPETLEEQAVANQILSAG